MKPYQSLKKEGKLASAPRKRSPPLASAFATCGVSVRGGEEGGVAQGKTIYGMREEAATGDPQGPLSPLPRARHYRIRPAHGNGPDEEIRMVKSKGIALKRVIQRKGYMRAGERLSRSPKVPGDVI